MIQIMPVATVLAGFTAAFLGTVRYFTTSPELALGNIAPQGKEKI
jgi:hypothetical protein